MRRSDYGLGERLTLWEVSGADTITGREVVIKVAAPDEKRATEEARTRGLFVSSVRRLDGLVEVPPREEGVALSRALKWPLWVATCLTLMATGAIAFRYILAPKPQAHEPEVSSTFEIRLASRNDESGDLVGSGQSNVFLIDRRSVPQADELFKEYFDTVSGKVRSMAQAGAKLAVFQMKCKELETQIHDEVKDTKSAAELEALTDASGPAVQRFLKAAAAMEVWEKAKADLAKQEADLKADYERLAAEMGEANDSQRARTIASLRSLAITTGETTTGGSCTLEGASNVKYTIIALPKNGIWYWRKPMNVEGTQKVFCGPSDTISLAKAATQP